MKISQKVFKETLMNEELQGLMHYFTEYLDELRNNNGQLSAYWMRYIDIVSILIGLIYGTREGTGTYIWHGFDSTSFRPLLMTK